MVDIIPKDFQNFMIDYLNETSFHYGINKVEISVIPCELIELILKFEEITNKITNFKVNSVIKKNDRVLLVINGHMLNYMIISFKNISSNIYEIHTALVGGIHSVSKYF